jgi:hypothetical protein
MKRLLAPLLISVTLVLSACNYDPRLDDQSAQKPPTPQPTAHWCLQGVALVLCQEGQQ